MDTLTPILADIDTDIPEGKLTMIVGLVASGKTSLLSAILEEMVTIRGSVKFNRYRNSVSYVAQRPWIQNATLRENILFGEEMNIDRYRTVIEVCALQPDIDNLPGGDMTEIGEKGINLSGGQKQRVSVARALYSNSAVIMLDDPLSALDVHVASHLFEKGILNFAMNELRTVILVTHDVQYLKYADKVIILEEGTISAQGNLNEIAYHCPVLLASMKEKVRISYESESKSESESNIKTKHRIPARGDVSVDYETQKNKTDTSVKLIQEEERNIGSVSWNTYFTYAKAIKLPLAALVVLLFFAQEVAQVLTNVWLANWSESGANTANKTEDKLSEELHSYLRGHGILAFIKTILALTAICCHTLFSLDASKRLHHVLLRNIFHAPMRFFDTTPVGRVMNRLSNDTYIIDQKLWQTVMWLTPYLIRFLSVVIVIVSATPVVFFALLPISLSYLVIMKYYIPTYRELKRLDSIMNSPIITHLSETLGGLATVRAYRVADRFRKRFTSHLNASVVTQLYLHSCNSWRSVRLEMLGALVVLASGLSSMLSCVFGDLEPSQVGLSITYALSISTIMSGSALEMGDCGTQMNAFERVSHYAKIDTEGYRGLLNPPCEWPSRGFIQFKNVSLRYSQDLDAVLHDITVCFEDGQKIGICGRTGSGKSTLALALFRMVDIFKGCILIDGIDIASVPLLTLRKRLSIIPQDPVLFSGSIRFNLDPYRIRTDDQIWEALEIAQLKQTVLDLHNRLDADIAEEGGNFSVGQRQLFCLARAFLRKSRILVMDEATASVDIKTDSILKRVIRGAFADRTVLTIAHRIDTIMDSDMVLVLDDGRVMEYDTPQNLLMRNDSMFTRLVKKTSF
ncbi:ATP-binding cassette sub-family C member 9-like [Ptychodera flava]|uniref:ATP-binding cassette sub-family C member 9-like n=1 Tax=Ptychodera flava TaxID=63121 RepID=UPI003969F2E9